MTAWFLNPLLCIDTETTGTNTDDDRIVEVGAVDVLPDGSPVNQWSTVVDPGIEIPAEATQVHGITTSRAIACGCEPETALQHLAHRITEHVNTWGPAAAPIVIFNATFDLPLLITECHRYGVEIPVPAILDPYLIDRLVDRQAFKRATARKEYHQFRKGRRQLARLCEHYGVDLLPDEAHTASADAAAAGQVMCQIIDRHPVLRDRSLAWLWLRQVRGHEEDRERFVDWMRRNRDAGFDKPSGWPIPVAAG